MPGDPAWRRPPQSRSGIRGPWAGPCDPSGHPAGSRLQNSGALRRDGVQVGVAATPCPSSAGRALPLNCLLPALFATMPAAGSPQTRHSRRGRRPPGTRAWGAGGRSSPPGPVRRPEARPRLLGSCSSLLPGSSFHMSPPSRSSAARPNPPCVGGGGGGPRPPRQPGPASAPRPPTQRGGCGGKVCCAGELRWRIPFPVYFDRKSERVFDQRKGDVIKGNRRMHNFLNHTKKYLFHYSKTSLTIQITC